MKTSLLLGAVFVLLAAGPGSAQTAPAGPPTQLPAHRGKHPKTPEQSAANHTAKLTKNLNLSADQQAKVQQIMLAEAQEAQATKAKYPAATQRQALHQAMQAGHAKYQAQLQAVLSADQQAKFAAMQQERKHKGGHADKMKAKS